MSSIPNFLDDLSQEQDEKTHILCTGASNSSGINLSVNPLKLGKFWVGFCDSIARCDRITLKEILKGDAPIAFRFNIHFASDANNEHYSDTFLHLLVYHAQQAIAEMFQDVERKNLLCVLLESEYWTTTPIAGQIPGTVINQLTKSPGRDEKHGDSAAVDTFSTIELHFPHAVCACKQVPQLLKRLIERLQKHNVFAKFITIPKNKWEEILDSDFSTKSRPLYGSVIRGGSNVRGGPVRVTFKAIYNQLEIEDPEDFELEEEDSEALSDVFKPQNHEGLRRRRISEATFEHKDIKSVEHQEGSEADSEGDPEHWLPVFLSVGYTDEVPLLIKQVASGPRKRREFDQKLMERYEEGTITNMETAELLWKIIDQKKRCESFSDWLNIGRTLISVVSDDTEGHERIPYEKALETWIRWSKPYNHSEEKCRHYHREILQSGGNCVTIKTLMWFAQIDNRERYSEWHRHFCEGAMQRAAQGAVSNTHTDIARAIHRRYHLQYLYSSNGAKSCWFEYSERCNRWVEIPDAIKLEKTINTSFVREVERIRGRVIQSQNDSNDEKYREQCEELVIGYSKLIMKLKTNNFRNALIRELRIMFHLQDADKFMDTNPMLLGVQDGVIECIDETYNSIGRNGHAIFRRGKPEDFIFRASSVCFLDNNGKTYTKDHPLVKETIRYLERLFTDPELRHHFLKFAASIIRGGNSDKIFPVFSGEGDNSKSMLIKLLEAVFGPYMVKVPTSLFTGKRTQSSNATPELARAKYARILVAQEPGPNEYMQAGPIKEYTGGDSFFARALHDNGSEIKALFKLLMICNKVPHIINADRATERRISIFPFLSLWSDKAPESEELQMRQAHFKLDEFFERRIPALAGPFLWLITELYYTPYLKEGLRKIPTAVSRYTQKYWDDNDVYRMFIRECIEIIESNDSLDSKHNSSNISDVKHNKQVVPVGSLLRARDVYDVFKNWWRSCFPTNKIPDFQTVTPELLRQGRLGPYPPGMMGWNNYRIVEDLHANAAPQMMKGNPYSKGGAAFSATGSAGVSGGLQVNYSNLTPLTYGNKKE
jgi:phage/plasmid-associated DNA primase